MAKPTLHLPAGRAGRRRTARDPAALGSVTEPPSAASAKSDGAASVGTEDRHAMIPQRAYLRAERRGFQPGYEMEDWLAAEREVESVPPGGRSSAMREG